MELIKEFISECIDNEIEELGQLYNHIEWMIQSKEDDFLKNLFIDDFKKFMECVWDYFQNDEEIEEYAEEEFKKLRSDLNV